MARDAGAGVTPRPPGARVRSTVLVRAGFLVAATLLIGAGWLLSDAARRSALAAQWVDHSHQVAVALVGAEAALARGEAAQRGYLLASDASFLAERDEAFAALRSAVENVVRLTLDNPPQAQLARTLQERVEERVQIAAESAARRGAGEAAANGLVTRGQQASQRIYALTDRMRAEERRLLQARRVEQHRRERNALAFLGVAVAVAFAVFVPAYLGLLRLVRRREMAEERLRDLADSLPASIYRMRSDAQGRLHAEFLSRGAGDLHGIDAAAAGTEVSKALLAPILAEDRPAVRRAVLRAMADASAFVAEYRVRRRDGSVRWMRSKAALRRESDGTVLWHGYWVDITERRELLDQLVHARIEADTANRAKSNFLAAMSHEIRTPMNGVLGMLELLSLTRLDREQRATLGVVRESALSLLRIIDDILDLSKVEAGQLALHPQPASVVEVVKRTWRMYSGVASAKGLVLQHAVADGIAEALWFDPLRLGQVLNNFVSNALKFTARGGVELRVELIGVQADRQHLRFVVKDTGIGIARQAQERLFQPYTQAGEEITQQYGGTGLGLVICKRLAEMMGGSIEMASEPEQGTTVSLSLWLAVADPAELPQVRLQEEQSDLVATLANRRVAPNAARAAEEGTLVLVVDDHPVNRALLVHQVNLLGYAADSTDNGLDALALWQQGRHAIVITDCNMPRMNGYDLARGIRAREAGQGGARTPIIACTANALAGEAETCSAAGMDDYLAKPVQLGQLMAMLDRWVPLPPSGAMPLDEAGPPGVGEPVDLAALGMFGTDVAAQRRTLALFREVNAADTAALRAAIVERDLPRVTELAHRIKGAAKAVGARGMAELAERIERGARRALWPPLDAAAAALAIEVESVNRQLDAL